MQLMLFWENKTFLQNQKNSNSGYKYWLGVPTKFLRNALLNIGFRCLVHRALARLTVSYFSECLLLQDQCDAT